MLLITLLALQLGLQPMAQDLDSPIHATFLAAEPDHLYVVEREGRVLRLILDDEADPKKVKLNVVLDIRKRINTRGERGLLAIAFPPHAKNHRVLYAHYNDKKGVTHLSRFEIGLHGLNEQILFTQEQPWANHNGGQLCFGPDGALYLGLGDGGAANDPQANGQNLETWLGGILRFDLSADEIKPELWHWGLRNPWRFSFDRKTGDMWIGDVGQNKWEEIDFAAAGEKHINFGWRWREGRHDFNPPNIPRKTEQGPVADNGWRSLLREPVWEYAQGGDPRSCSVTGGFVYRGKKLDLKYQGSYFFGDWASGRVWSGRPEIINGEKIIAATEEHEDLNLGFGLASFAEDARGEIYIINMPEGTILRVISGT
jgi:hypothetical protein